MKDAIAFLYFVLVAVCVVMLPWAGCIACLSSAGAQAPDPMAEALLADLRLPNGRQYVASCRHAAGGCEARVGRAVASIRAASEAAGIDPWVLASIARVESGLNPDAVGARGERTIFQLNPRRRDVTGREDERAAAFIAAGILARAVAICDDIDAGIGMYNTGRCAPDARYVGNVRRTYRRLRGRAGG